MHDVYDVRSISDLCNIETGKKEESVILVNYILVYFCLKQISSFGAICFRCVVTSTKFLELQHVMIINIL